MLGLTFRRPSFTQLIFRAAHCPRDLPLGRQITHSLPQLQGATAWQHPAASVATPFDTDHLLRSIKATSP